MQLNRKIGVIASLASLLLALPVAAQGAESQARGLNWRSDKDALPGTVMYSQIRQGSADVSTACVGGFTDKNCDAKTASLLVNNFLPTCDLEKVLDQPQPRVSELLNGRISTMSIEKLLDYLQRLGGLAHIRVTFQAPTAPNKRLRVAA